MGGTELLIATTVVLALLGVAELIAHRRTLAAIPIRIHVNGTRGKSSVVRLIAAGLRAGDRVTCAKTTGTLARMILPDGREVPIYRPSGANVIEQKRIAAAAAAHKAEVLIIECMALQPELQALCELKLINATHGIITNARPDHLDVMGPGDEDVARALCGMMPVKGVLYTAEQKQLPVLQGAAKDRDTKLVAYADADIRNAVSPEEMARFDHTEHPANVALALRVCGDLGIDRDVALGGMWKCRPDPGATTVSELDFFGRHIVFVNGFAANDPVSSQELWDQALERHGDSCRQRIAVINCRADRPDRSTTLGETFPAWTSADYVVLMGTGTYLFARAATKAGFDSMKLIFAEELRVDELFERVVDLIDDSALVIGLGNVGGLGLDLTRYFANRARPESRSHRHPPRAPRTEKPAEAPAEAG